MNTAFLSAIPAAPPQEAPVAPRAPKAAKAVIESEGPTDNAPVSESEPESTGDTDKADAFAEMLAAMISVATPAVDTHVETVQSVAVETVTSTATDVPRDGAGSPLFATSFMTAAPAASDGTAKTTSAGELSLPVDQAAGDVSQAGNAGARTETIAISEAAVTELAALDPATAEGDLEGTSLPQEFEGEMAAGATTARTPEVAEETGEQELPIVEARETIADPAAVQPETVDLPEPVAVAEQSVKTESSRAPSHRTDGKPAVSAKPEAPAPMVDESPGAEANTPVVSESRTVDSPAPPVAEAAPQNFAPVEEPYEEPTDPRANSEDDNSLQSASPRKAAGSGPRAVTAPAANPVEPEVVNPAPAVENPAEAGIRKSVSRERTTAPAATGEKSAATALEFEATLSAAAANGENSTAVTATSIASAHSDSAAVSTPSHVSQQVLQALAAYEAELPQGGSRSFEMLLDPPELGRLLVQMSRTSKGVDVRIAAENETVRSILETTGSEMQQSLQLSGFDLGQFSGSSSGGTFANSDEWVAAPSLQSFTAGGAVQGRSSAPQRPVNSAVNVMV